MPKSAYIRMNENSTTREVTLEEVKAKLEHYIEMTTHTGEQLAWTYAQAAFPYTIEETPEGKDQWFYLQGNNPEYKRIVFAVDQDEEGSFIQVVLPDGATHGDVAKGNEYCKFLGKEFKATVTLFNSRIMHFELKKLR